MATTVSWCPGIQNGISHCQLDETTNRTTDTQHFQRSDAIFLVCCLCPTVEACVFSLRQFRLYAESRGRVRLLAWLSLFFLCYVVLVAPNSFWAAVITIWPIISFNPSMASNSNCCFSIAVALKFFVIFFFCGLAFCAFWFLASRVVVEHGYLCRASVAEY